MTLKFTKASVSTLEIEILADEIRYHSDKYFNDEAEITDAEFDILIKEMKSRNPEHAVLAEVGADPSYGKKIAHDEVMGSLEKVTYDNEEEDTIDGLIEWCHKYRRPAGISATPKIDGLAVRLVYNDGKFVQAATRGNGMIGQDVTDNVLQIISIPNTIAHKGYVEIRGEIYMKKSVFKKYRQEMIDAGEKKIPANPRNMASGTLLQKDSTKTATIPLHFYAYDVRGLDEDWAATESEAAKKIGSIIPEISYVPTTHFENADFVDVAIFKFIQDSEKNRDSLDYQIDGLVFSANSFEIQKKYGYKGKCPVAKIAFKFRPEQTTTELIDIVWQLGRTGKLTPVAQLEPVELAGTTIDSPTLHNYAQVMAKGICIGDTVLIEKAGEIIPQVVRVVHKRIADKDREDRSVINYPEICPSCHEATELDEREVSVWCKNPVCPGQAEFRIIHFLKTIEVDGVGPGIVGKLVESGLVETIPDLFCLNFGEVSKLEGLGRSSARNILDAINDKKNIHLANFLDALGVEGLGTTTSKTLASFAETIENCLSVTEWSLNGLEGIGEKMAHSINVGLAKLAPMVEELIRMGVEIIPVEKKTGGSLSGMSFCITGTLSVGRKEMAALIESHGGDIKSSVSRGVTYLVAGEGVGKGKTDKAEKYGTTVIDEDTLRKMMDK